MDYRLGRGCDEMRHRQQEAEWKVGREIQAGCCQSLRPGYILSQSCTCGGEYVRSIAII